MQGKMSSRFFRPIRKPRVKCQRDDTIRMKVLCIRVETIS